MIHVVEPGLIPQVLLDSGRFDGVICRLDELPPTDQQKRRCFSFLAVLSLWLGIGCLIKGGTMHFEYISEVHTCVYQVCGSAACAKAVTQGIMRLNLDYKVPVPPLRTAQPVFLR